MPQPNEHSARLREPGDFNPDTFRRVADGKLYGRIPVPATVDVLWAKLKSADKPSDYPIAQGLRFPTNEWTEAKARKWLADNGVKVLRFEPAAADDQAGAAAALEFLSEAGGLTIEAAGGAGKLARFKIVAYTGGQLVVPGWSAPLVMELAALELPAELPVLADHDPTEPIGHGTPELAGGSLIVRGLVSIDSETSRAFVKAAKNGFPWGASIGAQVLSRRRIGAHESVTANGRSFAAGAMGLFHVTRAILREVSVLSLAADQKTTVDVAARGRRLEKDMPEQMTEEQIRAAERNRLGHIEAACKQLSGPRVEVLKGKAIAEEISVVELQAGLLELMRETRPAAPALHTGAGGGAASETVIEAAAVLSLLGEGEQTKAYDERTLEAADNLRGLGLQELIVCAAAVEGISLPRFRNQPRQWLHAAFSTVSVPGILSSVATKVLIDSFDSIEQTWRVVAKRSPVKDFKTSPRYRLTADTKYELVAPDGELKHAKLGEETWSLKADTYGKMVGITRQTIINDDLGAFAQLPAALGRGAGLSLNEIFWTEFMDNATFFTDVRNNYAEGAETPLSIDSLTVAEAMFLDQVDGDGHPIGIPPKTLLVPTDLNAVASQLVKSLEMRDPGSSSKVLIINPHAGKFTAVSSTYLKNSNYPGFSTKAWYLLADPNVLPVIEVAFLDGRESPTIETAAANFSTLGIEMRGFHDVAVSKADYKGGVKMKGEA